MLPNFEENYKELGEGLTKLSTIAIDVHKDVLSNFLSKDTNGLKKSVEGFKEFKALANDIDNKTVVLVARHQPEAVQLRTILATLKLTSELVRVYSSANTYVENATAAIESGFDYTPYKNEMTKLYETTLEALELSTNGYKTKDINDVLVEVKAKETVTDEYYQFLQDNILSSLVTKGENAKAAFKVLRTMRKLERVADHAVNISYLVDFAVTGGKLDSY